MNPIAKPLVFVNKNHELAWRCADAGVPVLPLLPEQTFAQREHEATTDRDKINEWWNTNPLADPIIYPGNRFCVVRVGHKASLPFPLDPTLHFTDKHFCITSYLYAFDDLLLIDEGASLTHHSIPVEFELDEDEFEAADTFKDDEIYVDNGQRWQILPEDTIGPFVFSPLPKWIVDRYWGEEFRGSKLDLPEDVTAAKDLLRKAGRPKDMVSLRFGGRDKLRPTEQEVREAEQILEDIDHDDLRQVIELAKAPRSDDQLVMICKRVFALGISEARARVLIDLYWNERGDPPYLRRKSPKP